ncbi:hypothetical protein PEPS_41460 (plasmid) [Persicobacter psychrovividus]|uniref:Uncharacterized protein n=1 Tax=Persicobacter psychrovividus TaxID=387638 RepID=A0ABN6LFY5_9BACT|nr:hypothetical protein PEPS_41460 [Persicobacter psychrovividus]
MESQQVHKMFTCFNNPEVNTSSAQNVYLLKYP